MTKYVSKNLVDILEEDFPEFKKYKKNIKYTFALYLQERHTNSRKHRFKQQFTAIPKNMVNIDLCGFPIDKYRTTRQNNQYKKYKSELRGLSEEAFFRKFMDTEKTETPFLHLEYMGNTHFRSCSAYSFTDILKPSIERWERVGFGEVYDTKGLKVNVKKKRKKITLKMEDATITDQGIMPNCLMLVNEEAVRNLMNEALDYKQGSFDFDSKLHKVLSEKDTIKKKEDKLSLIIYECQLILMLLENCGYGDRIPQTYSESRSGRLYGEGNENVQGMSKIVREAAMEGFYSYDIEACQPNIFYNLYQKHRTDHSEDDDITEIIDYTTNKTEYRKRLAKKAGISVELTKKILTSLFFGMSLNFKPNCEIYKMLNGDEDLYNNIVDHILDIHLEIHYASTYIVDHYKKISKNAGLDTNTSIVNHTGKIINVAENQKSKFMAHILQGFESDCLRGVMKYVSEQEDNEMVMLIHDGWVTKNEIHSSVFENVIKEVTGFDLKVDSETECEEEINEEEEIEIMKSVNHGKPYLNQKQIQEFMKCVNEIPFILDKKDINDENSFIYHYVNNNGFLKILKHNPQDVMMDINTKKLRLMARNPIFTHFADILYDKNKEKNDEILKCLYSLYKYENYFPYTNLTIERQGENNLSLFERYMNESFKDSQILGSLYMGSYLLYKAKKMNFDKEELETAYKRIRKSDFSDNDFKPQFFDKDDKLIVKNYANPTSEQTTEWETVEFHNTPSCIFYANSKYFPKFYEEDMKHMGMPSRIKSVINDKTGKYVDFKRRFKENLKMIEDDSEILDQASSFDTKLIW